MTPPEDVTPAEMRRALSKLPRRPKRPPRADIPSAAPSERTGLTALHRRGWSSESPDAVRYRLYRPGQDTGLCDDEQAACAAARRLEGR